LLLHAGATVFGVEPNDEMRAAAEHALSKNPNFLSVNASAEETTLAAGAFDLITAGQAFHWFDWDGARAEFKRILKPEGWVVLIWNDRASENDEFGRQYEALLQTYSPEYKEVRHRNIDGSKLTPFFRNSEMRVAFVPNVQPMNYEELEGRLLSSSYTPQARDSGYDDMVAALKKVFAETSVDGKVKFVYETQIYYGQV
jgi:SAM-dependent methyltransferase